MTKLTDRSLVKDMIGLGRADTLYDNILNGMIQQASDEAAEFCRRDFAKKARVEYFQSYEQLATDPTPQYIWLDGPVDTEQPLVIVYAMYGDHANGSEVTPENYILDAEQGLIKVRGGAGSLLYQLPIASRGMLYGQDPTGFQVTYTGGYAVSTPPNNHTPDPLDDFDVAAVPAGLKSILALKISEDFKDRKVLLPWTKEQKGSLKPYQKKDML